MIAHELSMTSVHTILSLAAEGGGLKILGVKKGDDWLFKLITDDQTPLMLDETSIHIDHGWVSSLSEALAQCLWTWNCLYPLAIHPDFAEAIVDKKIELDRLNGGNSYAERRWKKFDIKCVRDDKKQRG